MTPRADLVEPIGFKRGKSGRRAEAHGDFAEPHVGVTGQVIVGHEAI